ncbi:DUF3021 domain-containing protein [Lysinibacillus sp. NPDC094177]|uniref:DUF3021 domain-containing protein n=1 Tax=Lysinibacillus sp. NPDC094177 TaxID=3390580 RepID=UPI003D050008
MRKDLLNRIIGGFIIGVVLGQVVQFFVSMGIAQGNYAWVVPEFRVLFTNEIIAIITQVLLTGLIGITFALAALFFEIARWGMLKQYIVHFSVTAIIWIPIVMILWMPKTVANVCSLLASFLGTYVVTWLTQYKLSKRDIEKINEMLIERGEVHDN